MPNRQPPNDPNLERDLWGDDDRLERPTIDLTRKQRSDRAEPSHWSDEGETSNWDDADDYGREYDEPPGFGANAGEGKPEPEFGRAAGVNPSTNPSAKPSANPGAVTANIGDPELFDAIGDDTNDRADEPSRNGDDATNFDAAGLELAVNEADETSLETTSLEATSVEIDTESDRAEIERDSNDRTTDRKASDDSQSGSMDRSSEELSSKTTSRPERVSSETMREIATNATNIDADESEIEPAEEPTVEPTEQPDVTPAVADEGNDGGDKSPATETVLDKTTAIDINERREYTTFSATEVNQLDAQAQGLRQEIAQLQAQKRELQADLSRLVQESLQDLAAKRQELQGSVEQLERRQARIQEEMRTTFAGSSQDLAVRVQGFKEYLVGSLQDLSAAAERLKLSPGTSSSGRTSRPQAGRPQTDRPQTDRPQTSSSRPAQRDPGMRPISERPRSPQTSPQDPRRERTTPPVTQQSTPPLRLEQPERLERFNPPERSERNPARSVDQSANRNANRSADRSMDRNIEDPSFGKQGFQDQASFIRSALERYRDRPDYYGPPWQLRRTFQPVQADRVSDWFFNQSGRGVLRSMGSRLQNILIASTTISILRGIYDKRLRTLVLANSPERLGEWRRGLQDCLGITRNDFGPDRGITLFEDPMLMAQKAERLVKAGWLPLIVMDESEAQLNLSLLQFPLWLAFAADPSRSQSFDRDWLVR